MSKGAQILVGASAVALLLGWFAWSQVEEGAFIYYQTLEEFRETRQALETVKEAAYAKFDETVDVAVRLGVDPRHADQIVRGTVVLPAGTGREVRVLVIAQGDKAREAEEAGADYVYLNRFEAAWTLQRAVQAGIEQEIDQFRNKRQARNHYKPDRKEILS